MQYPLKVYSRRSTRAGATSATPLASPKLEIKLGGPPAPVRTQGSRKLSPASIIPVGSPLWCLGTQGVCMVIPPANLDRGGGQRLASAYSPYPDLYL